MSCRLSSEEKWYLESDQNIELVNVNTLTSYADEKDASDETDGEVIGDGQ